MPASFFSKKIPALSSTEHTLAEQSVQGSRNGIYIFATFAAWREIYPAINICEKELSQKNIVLATFAAWREIYNAINICEKELSQRRKERKDNDTTDYVSKQTGQTWWKL